MSKKTIASIVPCLMLLASLPAVAAAPPGPGGAPFEPLTVPRTPNTPQSTAHIDAAKKLANGDQQLTKAWNFFCTPMNFNGPGAELEPTKVFDNLYAIPSSTFQQTTVWAITTREGIILIDSGEVDKTEGIVAGMQKVGLDPAQVKYILLGHGHGDHFAGARYFQDRYGTRVGAGPGDWELMEAPPRLPPGVTGPPPAPIPAPKRDLELKEGTPIVLGEQTVNIVGFPGHTPGSLAFIFSVTDNGQKHTAGLVGGTILSQGNIPTEGHKRYLQSIDHYLGIARKMNVDVEIQNHAIFDDTPARLQKLKTRKPGEPHPFVMSTKKYGDFWGIVSECIQAELARRDAGPAK